MGRTLYNNNSTLHYYADKFSAQICCPSTPLHSILKKKGWKSLVDGGFKNKLSSSVGIIVRFRVPRKVHYSTELFNLATKQVLFFFSME